MPSAPTTAPELLAGLRQCAERYDGFLIDLWGVLHDGGTAYDGAADTLRALKAAGKKIALVSNSSDIEASVARKLQRLGFPPELYDALITSGSLVGQALRDDPALFRPGKRGKIFLIGTHQLVMQFDNPALDLVTEPEQAGLILNGWYGDAVEECAAWHDDMRHWIALDLPMLCMNPDIDCIDHGQRTACPGAFAAAYEKLGGKTSYYGKPHTPAFQAARAALGLPKARCAMIGDNMQTDIKGGLAFGLDTTLITGGVHQEFLGQVWGALPTPEQLAALCAAHGMVPTMAMGRLVY